MMLQSMLTSRATGDLKDYPEYMHLRSRFMADPFLCNLLPSFVRSCPTLPAFWSYIQGKAEKYAERRKIINEGFIPLMEFLEGRNIAPSDKLASETLETFDVEGVHSVWSKAIARRNSDPEGAITVARTLLETVTKRILDECDETYSDRDDLPKLYAKVAKTLNLGPSQHSEEPIKTIMGSAMNLVSGIGTLRNRLSDSHGRGGKWPDKPSPRHASLAVNTAGAIATFLVETYQEILR
ncbi:hypothetical protein PsW64_04800 [Pseudovibrio sp. W64]|nr:hypothetical protein PsW64_04800 [Pseudovibrio sp. W64]KZK82131.1 hypothetical protein PsAD13_03685 [Pseudovibrio sp. Ad13]